MFTLVMRATAMSMVMIFITMMFVSVMSHICRNDMIYHNTVKLCCLFSVVLHLAGRW
jgi:hypothetical protein